MVKQIISKNSNLVYKDNIWFSKAKSTLSYPDDGNELYYLVEDNSFWFNHRNNCILSTLDNFIEKRILFDLGGGNGYTSLYLKNNGIESVLVEPGINGIMNAQKRGIKNLICSTIEDLGLPENSIPNIGIFDVLEHIENDLDFLLNINKLLTKKGYLFITVPAYNILWSNEDINAGHYRRYTLKTMKRLLHEAKFKIRYSTYFFTILPIPIFISRSLLFLINKKRKSNANKIKSQHKRSNRLLQMLWNFENNQIKKNKRIPFGSSCLIVATKI